MGSETILSPFQFPILVEVLKDGISLADEFCLLSGRLQAEDSNGGLLSSAWKDQRKAKTTEDYDKFGYTSFYNSNLATKPEFNEIHKATVKQVQKYLAVMGTKKISFNLSNSWVSIYGKGHFVPEHIHPLAHLSVVFYAAATEGTGEIVFKNPAYSAYAMNYVADTAIFNDEMPIQPQKGMMIVFPSFIPHFTKSHEADAKRVIFSTNAEFKQFNDI